jgi:hypothetical protein
MREKLQSEVVKVGTKTLDYNNLKLYEAISVAVVAVLALTLGTIYGTILY